MTHQGTASQVTPSRRVTRSSARLATSSQYEANNGSTHSHLASPGPSRHQRTSRGPTRRQPTSVGPPRRQPTSVGPPRRQPTSVGPPRRQPTSVRPPRRQPTSPQPGQGQPASQGRRLTPQMKIRVLREIRSLLQDDKIDSVPIVPFCRIVRNVQMSMPNAPTRWTKKALEALQCACEMFLVILFEDAYLVAFSNKRATVIPEDMQMVLRRRNSNFFVPNE